MEDIWKNTKDLYLTRIFYENINNVASICKSLCNSFSNITFKNKYKTERNIATEQFKDNTEEIPTTSNVSVSIHASYPYHTFTNILKIKF